MRLGMIGVGRTGGNIVRRLSRKGHQCVVFDQNLVAIKVLVGKGVTGATDLKQLVSQLSCPLRALPIPRTGKPFRQTVVRHAQQIRRTC
jgi:6-phosphogluconate dehydrogenase